MNSLAHKLKEYFCHTCKTARGNYFRKLLKKTLTIITSFRLKYLFSNNFESTESICLEESGEIIRNEEKIGDIFCNFYQNIAANMSITKNFLSNKQT